MNETVRTAPFAPFEWLLSGRYLRARRKEGFISVIAGFSFLGIMKWVEPAGLVKFDFLGLKTLTVLDVAVKLLKQRDIDVDLATLPLDDAKSYQMLARGDVVGVFQVESQGMRRALVDMRPDRFGTRQLIVGFLVVERDRRQIELDAALFEEPHRGLQHRQRLQSEEVEFDEAGLLDPLHVELGHRHVGFGIAIERHQFAERSIADNNTRRMGGRMPGQAFEALGDVERSRDHRVLVAKRL